MAHDTTRPCLHALVIGAGAYRVLDPLTSPPLSAAEMARWIRDDYHNPDCEQRTVVELSAGVTRDAIKAAFKTWFERCHEREDNVAFFYFCGHAVEKGQETALLGEAFDRNALAPSDEAIDLAKTVLGMERCRARKQIFVLDVCRVNPSWLLAKGGLGQPLVEPDYDDRPSAEPRECPILCASAADQEAQAKPHQVSTFTRALVRVLDGAACENEWAGAWEVRAENLIRTVKALFEHWGIPPSRQRPTARGEVSGFRFHLPKKTPNVPVRLLCEDTTENLKARFVVRRDNVAVAEQPEPPSVDGWDIDLDVGDYEVLVKGPNERTRPLLVAPPCRKVPL